MKEKKYPFMKQILFYENVKFYTHISETKGAYAKWRPRIH